MVSISPHLTSPHRLMRHSFLLDYAVRPDLPGWEADVNAPNSLLRTLFQVGYFFAQDQCSIPIP